MSAHDERALAEAYSIGALDAPEKKLFEAHLVGCKICREAVREAGVSVQALALIAPSEKPPSGSGDRLMALYRQERASFGPPGHGGGNTLAVFFALVALGVSGWGWFEHDQVRTAQEEVQKLERELKDCHRAREILDAPDAQPITLKPYGDYTGPGAVVVFSPTKGVAVIANNLPKPGEGKVYRLWSCASADYKVENRQGMGAFQPGLHIDKGMPSRPPKGWAISEDPSPNEPEAKRIILIG